MKEYVIEISQNGWEYTGYVKVKCNEIKQVDDRTVIADGVTICFDEEINKPTRVDE